MSWTLTTAATDEVVSLSEAKLHLRVGDNDENSLVRSLTIAAREFAERFTGRQFVNATYTEAWDEFPADSGPIRPTWFPLSSITSVTYIDTDGVSQTFAASKYDTDTKMEPGRIALAFNESWPSTRSDIEAVIVVYVAGYGATAASVPDAIKSAIKLLVGHWYLNRESVADVRMTEVPQSVKSLLWAYRIHTVN